MAEAVDAMVGSARPPGGAHAGRGALSPPTAFALVLAALAVGLSALALARPHGAVDPASPARATDAVAARAALLEKEDALLEFRRLYALWLRAYRARDETLVPLFVAPDASGAMARIDDEIARMARDGVIDRSRMARRRLAVTELGRNQVRIRETVVQTSRFLDERSGEELARRRQPQLLEVIWTMRRYDEGWRLADSLVTAARPWDPR